MRGAFGKPQGTVARVHIGQPIMSVRSSDRYKAAVIEALRRAKFKFPGRQKVIIYMVKYQSIYNKKNLYYFYSLEVKLFPQKYNLVYIFYVVTMYFIYEMSFL